MAERKTCYHYYRRLLLHYFQHWLNQQLQTVVANDRVH